ncbi:hypothetical protein Emag_004958 [Eimeria magna]
MGVLPLFRPESWPLEDPHSHADKTQQAALLKIVAAVCCTSAAVGRRSIRRSLRQPTQPMLRLRRACGQERVNAAALISEAPGGPEPLRCCIRATAVPYSAAAAGAPRGPAGAEGATADPSEGCPVR